MSDFQSTPPIGARPIPPVPGYAIRDGGEVFSSLRKGPRGRFGPWHLVKPQKPTKQGYIRIELAGKKYCVHALVLEAFVGPCPPGLECCHKDGNPANNFVSNLRWGTRASNQADRKLHGTATIGEQVANSILKTDDIPEIFRQVKLGMKLCEIAKIHGVCPEAIGAVIRRTNWAHVPVENAEDIRIDHPRGERNSRSKLTDATVIEMFRLRSEGMSGKEIAERIGTSQGNVSMILARKKWSHVPVPAEYLPRAGAT
jgi:hypothetical protein